MNAAKINLTRKLALIQSDLDRALRIQEAGGYVTADQEWIAVPADHSARTVADAEARKAKVVAQLSQMTK